MFSSEVKYGPRLRMFLCYASSQDESYPAEGLCTQDKYACGWVSGKHASFPQELGFRFDGIVTIDSLRILANENKISSCIDVYVADPSLQEEQTGVCNPYSKSVFKRLGHIRFSTNAASGYRARELKTVGLQRRCTYLKLVLRNPHMNSFNVFQQVGIVALTTHGKVLKPTREWMGTHLCLPVGERSVVPLEEMLPPLSADTASSGTVAAVPTDIVERVAALNALKQRAVAEEDFDTAEALKQQVAAIDHNERQIAALELEKQRAVAVEDYQQAKQVKLRIQALRAETEKLANAQPGSALPNQTVEAAAGPVSPGNGAPSSLNGSATPATTPATTTNAAAVSAPRLLRGGVNEHDEVAVGGKGYYDLTDATGGLKQTEEPPAGVGEVPVTGGGEEWEHTLNSAIKKASTVLGGPSPLTGDEAAAARPYTAVFGIYCAACLFSRKGQQREGALRGLMSVDGSRALAAHSGSAWSQLVLYMSESGHGVGDPVTGAAMAACSALVKIVQGKLPGATANAVAEPVAKLLPVLVARLGEANTRLQESVEKTLISVARSPIGHRRVVELLLGDPDKLSKKPASSRAHVSRINILSTFVDDFDLTTSSPDGLDTRALCSLVLLPSLQHSNADVREAAIKLLAKLLCLDPGITGGYVQTIKPVQQALVEEQLEQYKVSQLTARRVTHKVSDIPSDSIAVQRRSGSGTGSYSQPSQYYHQQQQQQRRTSVPYVMDTNTTAEELKSTPASGLSPLKTASASIGEIEIRRLRTCQFCNEYNPNFNEHSLDLHYVSDCPMLCPCPLCNQVTEICQLQQHLVTECEKRRMVRECPRCHEAVRAADYNEHVAGKMCIEAVPTHSVCPLCHARFKSGMEGWRRHLASSPGCPHNPRKYDGSGRAN
jgi:centrosomal protein CEP104